MKKTNAMRYLDSLGISYEVIEYKITDGDVAGVNVAKKVGQAVENVYKTLVSRGKNIFVTIVPVDKEINLKKLAKAVGDKKVQMLAVKELLPCTGYVRGGCSPFAMKKTYPTYVQEDILLREFVLVSGGKIGIQLKLSVDDFLRASGATIVDVTD